MQAESSVWSACLDGLGTPIADQWNSAFALLQAFAERKGSAHVRVDHLEAGYPLGQWAATQRRWYKSGRLDAGRVKRLESLPGWRWQV